MLSLSLTQTPKLELTPEQKIEQKLALKQTLTQVLVDVFSEPNDPFKILNDIIIPMIRKKIGDEDLNVAITELLGLEEVQDNLIQKKGKFASDIINFQSLDDLAVEIFFDMNKGSFMDVDNDGNLLNNSKLPVLKRTLVDAFNNTQYIRDQLTVTMNLLQDKSIKDGTGLLKEGENYRSALRLKDIYSETITNFQSLLKFAFRIKGTSDSDRSIMHNFLRDLAIVPKVFSDLSETLSKSFSKDFYYVKKNSNSEDSRFRNSMLNSIIKFTLISMGILHKDIFVLQKFNNPQIYFEEIKDDYKKDGINYDELFNKLFGSYKDVIYYNRWHLIGQKLSHKSDTKIKNLISKIRAEDGEELLDEFEYDAVFEKIIDITTDYAGNKEEHRQDIRDRLENLYYESFSNNYFIKYLKRKISDKWHSQFHDALGTK